ncbi:MAG: hypothetical protein WCZ66_05670 [Sphingomonadaceae bacterium]
MRIRSGALCALLPIMLSTPALAHGVRADDHAPAGVMSDHVHGAGEVMIGLRLSREWFGGDMKAGTDKISDAEVAARGYGVGVHSMRMDMAMLDLMWAPSDRVTLMVMPHYMKMDMKMVGLPGDAHGGHGSGHMMMPGQIHDHSVDGFGDTEVSALISLTRDPAFRLHTTLGVHVPTGSVKKRDANGNFQHYMMQMGSGTWDLLTGLTATGNAGILGWGAQASYLFRAENRNSSGYRLGDRFTTTGWLSGRLSDAVSLSARAAYTDEGGIKGHYNGPHLHNSPPDFQANYGGRRLDLGAGVNFVATGGALHGFRLGLEYVRPVYEHVNGVQIGKTESLLVNVSKAF